jgi:hypothetical protein
MKTLESLVSLLTNDYSSFFVKQLVNSILIVSHQKFVINLISFASHIADIMNQDRYL